MPSALLLAPIALPLAAAALIALFGRAGLDAGRAGAAIGVWASAAALAGLWVPVRSTQELVLGQLGFGSAFDLRMDAAVFAFGLMVTVPAAILLSLQRRPWPEAALSVLCIASAVAALEAGGVVLTAIAGGTAATLAIVLLQTEDSRAARPSWAVLLAAWLALAWLGVIFQERGGTAVYSAVPVSAVTPAVFLLIVIAALITSGLLPWRAWPARLWLRPSLHASGVTVAALFPLGFYLLVRGYDLGDGRYPHTAFNIGLGFMGVVVAFVAAARAQAAPTRREFLGQVVPGLGGFALMAMADGTPLGLVAGLLMLASAAALTACLALLPDRQGVASLVAIAAAAGLPPGFVFGARALGIESGLEAGAVAGLVALAGMATWAFWMVGSARAIGLPPGGPKQGHGSHAAVAMAIALLTILAGPALAAIQVGFANPVALEVMPATAGSLGARLSAVVTTSSELPVLYLFLPLLLIAVLAYVLIGTAEIRSQLRPALLTLPVPAWWMRAREMALAARVPEQYRSLVNLPQIEALALDGRPWLWLGALAALAFAVTR
jgi:formate hydrogenlyase subunit 3/multisubunit Na+/H+ antiporter MnhD subunit